MTWEIIGKDDEWVARLGIFKVFSIFWDAVTPRSCAFDLGTTSRETDKRWKLTCRLPGMKSRLGNFATVEEAKEKAEKVLAFWLHGTGLIQKPIKEP